MRPKQIRVTRLICAPHKSLTVAASSSEPALFIVLSLARFRFDGTKSAGKQTTLEPGQTTWVARGQQERFENLGDTPLELLRFDLRTAPVEPKERLKKGGK